MPDDNLLFASMFTLFAGFLVFLASIANKKLHFSAVMDTYFVLFLILGLGISFAGLVFGQLWSFSNKSAVVENERRTKFPPYLSFGALLVVISFTIIFTYADLAKGLYYMSIVLSVGGIVLLLIGLKYFVQEVILPRSS